MRIPRLPAKLRHQARACRAKNGFQFVRDLQEPRALLDIRLALLTFSVVISLRSVIGLDRPSAERGRHAPLVDDHAASDSSRSDWMDTTWALRLACSAFSC